MSSATSAAGRLQFSVEKPNTVSQPMPSFGAAETVRFVRLLREQRPDLVVWGTVAPNLGWSNIARELVIDSGMDQATPAFTTVLACSTSMAAVFEAAGMLGHDMNVAMCGGVESMSRVQIGLKQGFSDWLRRFTQARSFGARIEAGQRVAGAKVG